MRNYDFYRKNNQIPYESTETNITDIKPKERILLKCIQCKETYSDAYKCRNTECPLYYIKIDWMKRPHTCSEEFLNNRKSFNWLKNKQL